MDKKPLVLFTGGLDSTALIYRYAVTKTPIDVFYIVGSQNARKAKIEIETRKKILQYIKDNVEGSSINDLGVIRNMIDSSCNKHVRLAQPSQWLLYTMLVVDQTHSKVDIAYVRGDCVLPFLERLERAWNELWVVTKNIPLVPLAFPFQHTSKVTFFLNLPKDLIDLTWTCERPTTDDKACGVCGTCINRKVEEYRHSLIDSGI